MRDHASVNEASDPGLSRQRYNTTRPGPESFTRSPLRPADGLVRRLCPRANERHCVRSFDTPVGTYRNHQATSFSSAA